LIYLNGDLNFTSNRHIAIDLGSRNLKSAYYAITISPLIVALSHRNHDLAIPLSFSHGHSRSEVHSLSRRQRCALFKVTAVFIIGLGHAYRMDEWLLCNCRADRVCQVIRNCLSLSARRVVKLNLKRVSPSFFRPQVGREDSITIQRDLAASPWRPGVRVDKFDSKTC